MKRVLILLLVWNTCFAQVPDNAVVNLNNVASVIGCDKSLSACFANANSNGFDSKYSKDGNWLSEFRNYQHGISWGYLNGSTSYGLDANFVIPQGDVSFNVKIDIKLASTSITRNIFEIEDVCTLYFDSVDQQIKLKFNADNTTFTYSSAANQYNTTDEITVGFFYNREYNPVIGDYDYMISVFSGYGSYTTRFKSFNISRGTKEFRLGYSNTIAGSKFYGYARNLRTAGLIGGATIVALWESNPPYTQVDITKVIL
jgi:hypothetical protein